MAKKTTPKPRKVTPIMIKGLLAELKSTTKRLDEIMELLEKHQKKLKE